MPEPIEVELPDGSIAEFPDGTDPQVIQSTLRKRFGIGQDDSSAWGLTKEAIGAGLQMFNPVPIAKGAQAISEEQLGQAKQAWNEGSPLAAAGHFLRATPVGAFTDLLIAQPAADQARQAREAFQKGDVTRAIGHGVATAVPMVGPGLAEMTESFASGDPHRQAQATGQLVASVLVPEAARRGTGVVAKAMPGLAARLEEGAAARVADVMTPKVGANKVRFGNKAAKVAPKLLDEPGVITKGTLSRESLQRAVSDRLDLAREGLDAADNARPANTLHSTAQAVSDIQAKIAELTGKPGPGGSPVVFGPNAERVAVLRQALKELQALGPDVEYGTLRRMRQAYDKQALVKYNPSLTQDFLKNQAAADGAADVAGVLRERLASADPNTAVANAEFSLYKSAADVLKAAEEVDRARPQVLRRIMARWAGAVTGGGMGSVTGAVMGYFLAPAVDSAIPAGLTTKLATARLMSDFAVQLRKGQVGPAQATLNQLRRGAVVPPAGPTAPPPASASSPQTPTPQPSAPIQMPYSARSMVGKPAVVPTTAPPVAAAPAPRAWPPAAATPAPTPTPTAPNPTGYIQRLGLNSEPPIRIIPGEYTPVPIPKGEVFTGTNPDAMFPRVFADAKRNGYQGSLSDLRTLYRDAVTAAEEARGEAMGSVRDASRGGREASASILTDIKKLGGIKIPKGFAAETSEWRWLQEGGSGVTMRSTKTKGTTIRRNASGSLGRVPGIFKSEGSTSGLSPDAMVSELRQLGYDIVDGNDLHRVLTDITTKQKRFRSGRVTMTMGEALERVGVRPGAKWWDATDTTFNPDEFR